MPSRGLIVRLLRNATRHANAHRLALVSPVPTVRTVGINDDDGGGGGDDVHNNNNNNNNTDPSQGQYSYRDLIRSSGDIACALRDRYCLGQDEEECIAFLCPPDEPYVSVQ